MKLSIRKGVFETNSSSVHTLVLAKSKSLSELEEIAKDYDVYITGGNFDWGWEVLSSPQEKLNYLWTFVTLLDDYSYVNVFRSMLNSCGISYDFNEGYDGKPIGGIDHNNGWKNRELDRNILIDIIYDKDKFLHYVFDDNSVMIISNDNDDFDDEENEIISRTESRDPEPEVFVKYN